MDTVARHEQLKVALTDAAARTITAQGLAGLKARALADEAGCAVGAIYNVVADLDELILLVNARTLTALEQALADAAPSAAATPADQLVALALAYLEFAVAHRLPWRALFDHRLPAGRATPDWYQRDLERLFDFVERPIARLVPGTLPQRRRLLARSLFSAVHGVVVLGLEEKLELIPLATLREQVATIIRALGVGLSDHG